MTNCTFASSFSTFLCHCCSQRF